MEPRLQDGARALVKWHEGCVLGATPDRQGWSIGWGHDGALPGQLWTQAQADGEFEADFERAFRGAVSAMGAPSWQRLDLVRQAVLIDMTFELGWDGLREFEQMLNAVRAGDWKGAQMEGLWDGPGVPTRWAREVPSRASCDMEMMMSGQWPKELGL